MGDEWFLDEMIIRKKICSFKYCGFHKGFYNDKDIFTALNSINYSDFFEKPDNDEFPFETAEQLLRGACHLFALSLHKLLNYNVYIIEENDKKNFHAFCQVYRNKILYYVDARGVTTSFDEFMGIAKQFVRGEYTIRAVSDDDVKELEKDGDYNKEAYEFAEAVIKKFKDCYTVY